MIEVMFAREINFGAVRLTAPRSGSRFWDPFEGFTQ